MESRRTERPLALRPDAEPIPGYRLVRRRGRGGFGEVWEAEASGGIRVALKFVHGTDRAQAAELRALNVFRGIRHPNLLANFAAWQVDGNLIVGMELADGSLWDRYVQAADEGLGGIPRGELLGYMLDAAGALDYLNEPRHSVDGREGVGIQHRDIKPPNILLFGAGAKVADLGMARALEGETAGHTGTWTYSYAAPEFFRGRTTRQSDQYGLATTYCQLRSGRLPFEGGVASVTAGHLYGQPNLESLPEAERPILERALAKEPLDRWPDCRGFVEALRALEPSEAPEHLPRPDEPPDDLPRPLRPSTGFAWVAPDDSGDTPPPSWRDFDTGGDLESLLNTPETSAAPESTAIRPEPESVALGRRKAGGSGRLAASALTVALAITAAGVRPTSDGDQAPPAKPDQAEAVPGPIAVPVVEPGPPAGPPQPAPEVEPAPAQAADEIRPASTQTFETDAPEPAPATRSDLVPGPRTRVDPDPSSEAARAEALGREHFAKNELDRAIAEFDRAIRLRPGVATIYLQRALARHRASHYPEALADYSEAIRLRPTDPIAFIARGQAHHDLGAYDRAVADYSEAIRLRPTDPTSLFRRGMAHYRSDDYAGALADFDETLRLDPKNHRAREFREDALARLGGRVRDGSAPRPAASKRPGSR